MSLMEKGHKLEQNDFQQLGKNLDVKFVVPSKIKWHTLTNQPKVDHFSNKYHSDIDLSCNF